MMKRKDEFVTALNLVKSNIKGTRKWIDEPQYMHSIRVSDILCKHRTSYNVRLAWLLHDMIEDTDYTREDLKEIWFSDRVLDLVCLCSHDKTNPDTLGRRKDMVNRLIDSKDIDAWAIKLADITDNLKECHLLSSAALKRFLTIKAPVFIYYWNKYFWGTNLYKEFLEEYYKQYKDFILKN